MTGGFLTELVGTIVLQVWQKGQAHMEKISPEDLRSKISRNLKQDLRSLQVNEVVTEVGLANDKFFAYHCKAVKSIGANKYLALADIARKGKNPQTLFSWLLKQECVR